ncbi:DNA-binding CsgD family transcriptional regulator [Hoeflea marina]|uniref:DNA-binding CsgD family transcriptional regulator n=1 Tax=Hoeflea marina TaxID=274592 RepID=A0A317PDI2_9HYPH|nr:LuxR family transcriptional regulator [Hoeflea marina]PWV97538.1 DNA-binding CsgD family transcriptional regulator [Hoeflea marina]
MTGDNDLFDALANIQSEVDLAAYLHRTAREYGLAGFMIVDVPSVSDERLQPRISLSNMPKGFLEEYDRQGLLKNSLIFGNLRRTTIPTVWSLDDITSGRPAIENEPMRELFRRHHISMGVFFPVHGVDGSRAAIGFDGDRPPLTQLEISQLGMLVVHAYAIYCTLKNPAGPPASNLTGRELEVLHWAANGKTSVEIAAILSLSDHTVNTYMNTAMRKLDCVNRTQLVAKAMRLRLIS